MSEIQTGAAGVFSAFPQSNSSGNFQKVTQVIPVRITIDDTKGLALAPGMNVTAKIHRGPVSTDTAAARRPRSTSRRRARAARSLPATGPAAAPPQPHPRRRRSTERAHWVVPVLVLVAGMFMSVLDTSIVNVAMAIQTDFGGSTADVAWISTAYSLVLGVVVPASAWLGDRFGMSRVYMLSLAAFALGSALCGLAWNLDSLIAFRVIQAIPGGLLPAISLTMVYRIVPRRKIGAAMGMYGLGIIFAPAIGPALGGYLVEYVNWRLVFYINIPVGILGVIAAVIFLPKFARAADPEVRRRRLRHHRQRPGLPAAGLLRGPVVGLDRLPRARPDRVRRAGLWRVRGDRARGGVPAAEPAGVPEPAYTTSLIAMSVMMTGLFATLFYIPLFLQAGLGYPALKAGLLILPQALVMGVLMPIAGRLYDKIGPRYLAFFGLLIAATGTFLLTGISPDMTRGELVRWMCIRAVGTGLAMMPIMTGGLSSLPRVLTTSGSAINTVAQRVSAALGLAGLTAVVTNQQAQLAAGRAGPAAGVGGSAVASAAAPAVRGLPAHPSRCVRPVAVERVPADLDHHAGRRVHRPRPALRSAAPRRRRPRDDRLTPPPDFAPRMLPRAISARRKPTFMAQSLGFSPPPRHRPPPRAFFQ